MPTVSGRRAGPTTSVKEIKSLLISKMGVDKKDLKGGVKGEFTVYPTYI